MGQQQLLLIILGVIIVGIAIAVGLQLFQAGSVGANMDAIVNDIMNISGHAEQYRIRPESMGGGGGDLDNYSLPARLEETGNGRYSIDISDDTFTIVGESVPYDGNSVELDYNPAGDTDAQRYTWRFIGDLFQDADAGTQ